MAGGRSVILHPPTSPCSAWEHARAACLSPRAAGTGPLRRGGGCPPPALHALANLGARGGGGCRAAGVHRLGAGGAPTCCWWKESPSPPLSPSPSSPCPSPLIYCSFGRGAGGGQGVAGVGRGWQGSARVGRSRRRPPFVGVPHNDPAQAVCSARWVITVPGRMGRGGEGGCQGRRSHRDPPATRSCVAAARPSPGTICSEVAAPSGEAVAPAAALRRTDRWWWV